MKKAKRLSNIIALYLLLCFIFFLIIIIILTFTNTQNTIDNEIRLSFEQRYNIAKIIIQQRLDKTDQILQDISQNDFFISSFISKDSSMMKDILLDINYYYSESRLDILFCMSYNNEQLANASSKLYNTDILIPNIYSRLKDVHNIPGIDFHTYYKILHINNLILLMKYSPIINKATGHQLGILIGGTILNDNLAIINKIKEITDVEAVYFFYNNQQIAASDLPNSTTREIILNSDFTEEKGSINRESGYIYAIQDFSLNEQIPILSIAFIISDLSLMQLLYSYIPSVIILLLILIIVMMVIIQLIRRLTSNSLNPLLKYSADISSGNYDSHFYESFITEFNELGFAMERMVKNLKKSNIKLKKEISDRKRLEKEKLSIQEQLIQSQKMETVGTLAGGLAHDFNNILGAIIGTAYVMDHDIKSNRYSIKQVIEDINTIKVSAKMGKQVVERLLALARKQTLSFVPVEISLVIKDVIKICQNTFDKCIEINFNKNKQKYTIKGDKYHLEQIFLNILVNSSHAMTIMRKENETHGGIIQITTEKITADKNISKKYKNVVLGKDYVAIKITDTGVGMTQKTISKIFNPFFTTKDKNQGTGLGLSMAYNIIQQLKGFIKIESQPGEGSAFTVFFPLFSSKKEIVYQKKTKKIIEGSELILVIDDDEAIRKTYKRMLTICGYNVILADNPIDGISIYKDKADTIDAVILDMSMPKKSGYDTYIELKEINPDIKVLLASGFGQDKKVQKIMELGVNDFMHKPFSIVMLSKKLFKILKG